MQGVSYTRGGGGGGRGRLLERGIFYKLKSVGVIRQEAFIIELEGVY